MAYQWNELEKTGNKVSTWDNTTVSIGNNTGITAATVDYSIFNNKITEAGKHTFTYKSFDYSDPTATDDWSYNNKVVELGDYGINATGSPVDGDTIVVTLIRKYDDVHYPSEKLVKDTIDKLEEDITTTIDKLEEDLAEGNIVIAQVTNATNAIISEYAKYASEDKSKGTIEERLTNLGFKEGVAEYSGFNGNPQSNSLKKQGKYVIFNFNVLSATSAINANQTITITIPDGFKPKENIQFYALNGNMYASSAITLTIDTNGIITYTTGNANCVNFHILNIGWETN